MTVQELIDRLSKFDPKMDVMILDSIGASDINTGPYTYFIRESDEENCGDCDGRAGDQVVVIGSRF